MKACISQVTTLGTPFEADLPAYARAGWTAVEVWLTKLEEFLARASVAEAKARLEEEGLAPVSAAGQGGLLLSQGEERRAHWDHFRRRLDVLAGLGVPTLVIAADAAAEPEAEHYPRAVASLVEAAEVARGRGVRLALEFSQASRFCASLDTAAALVEQAGTDGLGICLDLFHYYTGPSKFEDLAYLSPANLAWVQLCDLGGTPRELAGDADRVLPGDGDFRIDSILEQLGRVGYDGYVSVELFNPALWRIPADRVADVARQATLRLLRDGPRAELAAAGGP